MSEKMQHTAASMRERMTNRYGNQLIHKHNKNRSPYRLHNKTHPCIPSNGLDEEEQLVGSTGSLRKFKLRKLRKRLDKGRFH